MAVSILALEDRISLGNGMNLRLLSAMELLQARREAEELAKGEWERPLCSNACILARALEVDGEERPFFDGGEAVLTGLTREEIDALAGRWEAFRAKNDPGLELEGPALETPGPCSGRTAPSGCTGGCSSSLACCPERRGQRG